MTANPPSSTTAFHEIEQAHAAQLSLFHSGLSQSFKWRVAQLDTLQRLVRENEVALLDALQADLGKSHFEGHATELGLVYEEIKTARKNLKRWMRPKRVSAGLVNFPSSAYIRPEPKGVALIISPWNYPASLLLTPIVGAFAAGNPVLLKPSEISVHTAAKLKELFEAYFAPEVAFVILGPGEESIPPTVEKLSLGHLFFTGSTAVGRKMAEMAAPKLLPCTLELGGKSPLIVHHDANIKVTAARTSFGKWLNAGQTCIAPDYLLVHQSVKDALVEELKGQIERFFPGGALAHPDYGRIISEKHFDRLIGLLEGAHLLCGGQYNRETLSIEPTIVELRDHDHPLMQGEIFGPILPVLSYSSVEEAKSIIARNPNPLSLYVFSSSKDIQRSFLHGIAFGGGMANNTILHLTAPTLPFGGIGASGMGQYHGKFSFDTFSHQKTIMKTATWFDLPQKYPPYTELARKVVRFFFG